MSTSRSPKKTKRSYSLRSSRLPRSPALLDTSTGFYDRLEEIDYPDACQIGTLEPLKTSGSTEGPDFSVSGQLREPNGKSPLITEEPKGVQSKRKRRAKSLRVTKTESRVFLMETSVYEELEAATLAQEEAPRAAEEPAPGEAAQVPCCLGMDDSQQLIEGPQEVKDDETERKKQKSNKMKQYKKTIDRAFRRGWETFVANLYTVSLSRSAASPASAPPPPPLVKAC